MSVSGSSLVSVLRILSDARFRQSIVGKVSDPIVRAFWEKEFAAMHRDRSGLSTLTVRLLTLTLDS